MRIKIIDRNRTGGGVCINTHQDISFHTRHDLIHNQIEGIWVEILLPKAKPIILGTCYTPILKTISIRF